MLFNTNRRLLVICGLLLIACSFCIEFAGAQDCTGVVPTYQSRGVILCAGSYPLPSGKIVSQSGTYLDTLRYTTGCDSVIFTIVLDKKVVNTNTLDASICDGSSYMLPSGKIIKLPGSYKDVIKYPIGCDSLVTFVNLDVLTKTINNTSVTICAGQPYALPSGKMINSPGIYSDTLYYTSGCDSVVDIITVSEKALIKQNLNAFICSGSSYTLPSGKQVTVAGTFYDTVKYASGCDSLISQVDLTINPITTQTTAINLCQGQSHNLPWGVAINTAGEYRDTLRYTTNCDSVIRIVQVTVSTPMEWDSSVTICSGASYALPSGAIVTMPGVYRDTLHYLNGCDSVIRIIHVSVNSPSLIILSPAICGGAAYTLPWGITVNKAGIYKDTLHYTTGCDSLIRIVDLSVAPVLRKQSSVSLCEGDSVILPWGVTTNAPGIYRDTLHNSNGCDSFITEVTVLLNIVTRINTTVSFCAGSTYTLPWGMVVNTAGTFKDTLRYVSGCDSVITTVQLTANTLTTVIAAASICSNQSFTLPWGTIVSVAGVYADTLHYTSGCDSVIRIIDLSVNAPAKQIIDTSICSGNSYTLPWGAITILPGTYSDTLHAIGGCDSLIRIVDLSVTPVVRRDTAAVLCSGQFFLSPAGNKIYSAGLYFDTLRYKSGCDSIIFRISVSGRPVAYKTMDASVCYGHWYTLPSGKKINMPGTYLDTLKYKIGCDSMVTTVNLSVLTAQIQNTAVSVCLGNGYTLPWGTIATDPGSYRDTLRNVLGCDSLVRVIDVQTISAKTVSANASVCRGEDYVLPWGPAVKNAGIYSDTIRTVAGCDSVIRITNLAVMEKPVISVSKSNDINCTLGSAKLTASGGSQYQWSPVVGLDKTDVFNPVAAPSATTTYHVQVTSKYGCTSEDSIQVIVSTAISGESFLMPNAFTPNGDNLNDCFSIRHWGSVSNLHFSVYDRWGKLIFYTENPSQCWDGSNGGKALPSGVYVYAITAKTICGDVVRKGTVTLIR